MSDDVRDAGLVAMISSILGGNKRADSAAPPPLTEGPPTAPADRFEPVEASDPDPAPAEPDDTSHAAPAAAKPAEPPAKIATTPDGKQLLPAEAIADLVLGELRKLDDFPASGASV